MKSGEANMDMREKTERYPTKSCLLGGSKTRKLTKTITANTEKTASNSPSIFNCKKKQFCVP